MGGRLSLFLLVLAGTVQGFGQTPLRIITWNIDRGTHLDQIADGLRNLHCNVCLLQEVDLHTARTGLADVATALGKRLQLDPVYGAEFEELSQEQDRKAYSGQATLTSLRVCRSRVLRFQHQSAFWEPHAWMPSNIPLLQRRQGGRIALVTELEWAGKPLIIYNAHLESRSLGSIQMAQLNEMLDDAKANYPASSRVVIGGDLNTKYLPSRYRDRFETAKFRSVLGDRIERTHTIAMALDWIFVRGDLKVIEGSVREHVSGSDHYPVSALLAVQ